MLKHLLALLILSVIVVLFLPQFSDFLHYVGFFHAWLAQKFLLLFPQNATGHLMSHVLALLLIPLIVALIPAFLYWLARRGEMPHIVTLTWVIWIMLATIIALR